MARDASARDTGPYWAFSRDSPPLALRRLCLQKVLKPAHFHPVFQANSLTLTETPFDQQEEDRSDSSRKS